MQIKRFGAVLLHIQNLIPKIPLYDPATVTQKVFEMTTYVFSSLTNGQHLSFNVATDSLSFIGVADTGSAVQISVAGGNLGLTLAGLTIWLDGVSPQQLALSNTVFPNGSNISMGDTTINPFRDWYGQAYSYGGSTVGEYVNGLGGGDDVTTGSGKDVLVGNVAMGPIVHVSRIGGVGAPTNSYTPSISADGNLVGFGGSWTAFGSPNNTAVDVLVRNILTGSVVNEERDALGLAGGSGSDDPMISADGNWMVFTSGADLVAGTPPAGTIYRAALNGLEIAAVSTTAAGIFANGASSSADVSQNGRYVTFASAATNLAAGGDVSFYDIFRKDMLTGALVRVSTGAGVDANGECSDPHISADGRYVVYSSTATNLTAAETGSFYADIYLWDAVTNTTANITESGVGFNSALNPDIAKDGAYGGVIVFQTRTAFVAADTNTNYDIYAYDMTNGTFALVSSTAAGTPVASGDSENPSISGDGRFVVFSSGSSALVNGDTNFFSDIFVKDLLTGAIALVSRTPTTQGNQNTGGSAEISAGGEWIVFETSASNLSTTDTNGNLTDVYRVANPLLFDTLRGGTGDDTYILARNDIVIEGVNAGNDTVRSSITYTLGSNLENLALTGLANINGVGNTLNNTLGSNAGNNTLHGSTGSDTASYADAPGPVTVSLAIATAQATGHGSDTLISIENLTGSAFNDRLTGNAGDNRLNGGLGNDTMTGADGNDAYYTNSAADVIVESSLATGGVDTVNSAVTWTLGGLLENLTLLGTAAINGGGNSKNNVLIGNSANNTLTGYSGNDVLSGGLGNDTLNGGFGDDIYVVNSSADVIIEAASTTGGVDTVKSAVSWTIGAFLENLTLDGVAAINGGGNSGNNILIGNTAGNILSGGNGNDTLSGGLGNDTVNGGAGNDRLLGGGGVDRFLFNSTVGADLVADFAVGSDKLAFQISALQIGDSDLSLEGGSVRAAPGGFTAAAELVIFRANIAAISTAAASVVIGSATTAYAVGQKALFSVDNGSDTAVFLFTSADANTIVSASELKLLTLLDMVTTTAVSDYLFVA